MFLECALRGSPDSKLWGCMDHQPPRRGGLGGQLSNLMTTQWFKVWFVGIVAGSLLLASMIHGPAPPIVRREVHVVLPPVVTGVPVFGAAGDAPFLAAVPGHRSRSPPPVAAPPRDPSVPGAIAPIAPRANTVVTEVKAMREGDEDETPPSIAPQRKGTANQSPKVRHNAQDWGIGEVRPRLNAATASNVLERYPDLSGRQPPRPRKPQPLHTDAPSSALVRRPRVTPHVRDAEGIARDGPATNNRAGMHSGAGGAAIGTIADSSWPPLPLFLQCGDIPKHVTRIKKKAASGGKVKKDYRVGVLADLEGLLSRRRRETATADNRDSNADVQTHKAWNGREVMLFKCPVKNCRDGIHAMLELRGRPHILPLLGWCTQSETAVVPFMGPKPERRKLPQITGAAFSWPERLRIARGIMESLQHVHRIGRIFCDNKESQWLLDDRGEAIAIDFDATPLVPNICNGANVKQFRTKLHKALGPDDKCNAFFSKHFGWLDEPVSTARRKEYLAALGLAPHATASVREIERAFVARRGELEVDVAAAIGSLFASTAGSAAVGRGPTLLDRAMPRPYRGLIPPRSPSEHARGESGDIRGISEAWYVLTRQHPKWPKKLKHAPLWDRAYDNFAVSSTLRGLFFGTTAKPAQYKSFPRAASASEVASRGAQALLDRLLLRRGPLVELSDSTGTGNVIATDRYGTIPDPCMHALHAHTPSTLPAFLTFCCAFPYFIFKFINKTYCVRVPITHILTSGYPTGHRLHCIHKMLRPTGKLFSGWIN